MLTKHVYNMHLKTGKTIGGKVEVFKWSKWNCDENVEKLAKIGVSLHLLSRYGLQDTE